MELITEHEIEQKIFEIKHLRRQLRELRNESNHNSTQERTKRMKIRLHEKILKKAEDELHEMTHGEVLLPPLEW